MNAGTHTPPRAGSLPEQVTRSAGKKQKWTLVFAGTAATLLVAGILYQVFRPIPGAAQEQPQQQTRAAKANVTDAVARVNGEVITKNEVADECMLSYGNDVLDKIINRKLIEQACAAKKVEVTEAEVDQEIVKIASKFNMPLGEWYKMLQSERNVTEAQYRRDIIWPMLALKKLAGDDVKISKKDMQEAFERNYGERVKVRIIVLDNIRRANECWEKVNEHPEEFERLVRQYSIDASSRALDGSVPPIRRFSGNKASEPLEEAAFKLKKGEISGIIQADANQFVIMTCEGRTEPVVTDPKDVQKHLFEELKEEKIQQSVATVFSRIREEATIVNHRTGKVQDGKKKTVSTKSAPVIKQAGAKTTTNSDAKPSASARKGGAAAISTDE